MGADARTDPWEELEEAVLGGHLQEAQLSQTIVLAGKLSALIRRTRPAAERIAEDAAFQAWMEAVGVLPLLRLSDGPIIMRLCEGQGADQ